MTSKADLINRAYSIAKIDIERIEDCGNGVAYCHLLNSSFKNFPIHKVNFKASRSWDILPNFKLIQECLAAHKINKVSSLYSSSHL